jgi:hypothetical protein
MKMLRWFAWLVGALVIGALGNAVWELAFLDFYGWSSRTLLTIVTFGLDSVRNSIYTRVAQGHHEESSLFLLMLVLSGGMGSFLGFATWQVARRILFEKPTGEEERQRQPRLRSGVFNAMLGCIFFFWAVLFGQFVIMLYTNLAITHFEHSLVICAPYLTHEEEQAIRSQFALLKTSTDYEAVVRRLQAIAAQHGIALREFTIW